MTIDGILTSAVGQLVAISVVAVAYGLIKIVALLNKIRVALRQVHVVVKCEKG